MGDIWDAFEARQARQATKGSISPNSKLLANPSMLAATAKTHFRNADFTGSGRIDEDEALEALATVAEKSGFPTPPEETLRILLSKCIKKKGAVNSEEFAEFVKAVATYKDEEKPAPPTPAPPTPAPPTPAPPTPAPPTSAPPTPAPPTPAPPTPAPPTLAPPTLAPPTPAALPSSQKSSVTPSSLLPASPLPPMLLPSAAPRSMAKAGDYVGTLRVHVLDAEGLSCRDDGSARQAYATVNVTDFSKRRTARTSVVEGASTVTWGEIFDFKDTPMPHALVVVDLWDAGTAPVLLGKARLSLEGVRLGVPHITFQPLLDGGMLVLRVDFDSGLNS